jgi:hypothetical protein
MVYFKIGRHADAESMVANLRASQGDSYAYEYAEIYAQRGNVVESLRWLETALRIRDVGLLDLKTDRLLDPVRDEPRFRAIERALNFPN